MNDLGRELAPITSKAWEEIEDEAQTTLKTYLAARKLVDFSGPRGWDHSAVNLGRVDRLDSPAEGVETRGRRVLPLVELRVPFELARDELDAVDRGADDADLDPLVEAARRLAFAEDRIVFHGYDDGDMFGLCSTTEHEPIARPDDFSRYPEAVSEAVNVLRTAGVGGPYAVALSPEEYTGLATTVCGAYPVMQHIAGILDGPIVWAPALDGAVVLSARGGDFELVVGRDISIGYMDHDATVVRLYLEESLAFRVLAPEAAVTLQRED